MARDNSVTRQEPPGLCAEGADHREFDATNEQDRQGVALMLEGVCPSCKLPGSRTHDSFVACACCKFEWSIRTPFVIVRFDISAFFVPPASDEMGGA